MVDLIIKLQRTDFVIYEIFFLITLGLWLWTFFFDGAKRWSDGLKTYYESIGFPLLAKLNSPLYLKLMVTFALLGVLGGGYGIVLNKLRNF